MSTYDVRSNNEEVIDEIVFADAKDAEDDPQVYRILRNLDYGEYITIEDMNSNFAIINSKEHALNLIKALNKAIELGWVE